MSLITDEVLSALWHEVHNNPSDVWASLTFWCHLWNKFIFTEKQWVITIEPPQPATTRRLVDISIGYLNSGRKEELSEACGNYLTENGAASYIDAISSVGTKARGWQYHRDGGLQALHEQTADSGWYMEIDSPEAGVHKSVFDTIKNDQPSEALRK
ncbi:hypothetical protein BJX70DRAFT_393475 [Aspergillus crustosus]